MENRSEIRFSERAVGGKKPPFYNPGKNTIAVLKYEIQIGLTERNGKSIDRNIFNRRRQSSFGTLG